MTIVETTENRFIIKSIDSNCEPLNYTVKMETPKEHSEWLSKIESILDSQQELLNIFSNPISHQVQRAQQKM